MKRLFAIMLVLCLVFTVLPMPAEAATTASGSYGSGKTIKWSLNSKGTLTISGSGTMNVPLAANANSNPWLKYREDIIAVVIQSKVTDIGDYAFYDCDNLTKVTVMGKITEIGESAFRSCEKLETVEFTNGMSGEIGKEAFSYCTSLTAFDVPEDVERIMEDAFVGCSKLSSVTLPEGLNSIWDGAFRETALVSVTIPQNVDYVGAGIFAFCYSLKNVTMHTAAVEGIKQNLGYTDALEYVHIIGDAPQTSAEVFPEHSGKFVVYYDEGTSGWVSPTWNGYVIAPWGQTHITISDVCGDNLTWIIDDDTLTVFCTGPLYDYDSYNQPGRAPWHNFSDWFNKVVIQDGATHIGDNAFAGLKEITCVSIPGSVKTIGNDYFAGGDSFSQCSGLTEIVIPDGVEYISNNTFSGCFNLTSVKMADSVKKLGSDVFLECGSLTNVQLSRNLSEIPDSLFYGCRKLAEVNIPEGVTTIGASAFHACFALRTLELPDGLETLKGSALASTGLTEITIPASVTSLDAFALSNCSDLARIQFLGDAPTFGYDVFSNVTATAYYLKDNATWTADVMQNYGGNITWVAVDHFHQYVAAVTVPTYTEKGYTTHTCDCGDSYVDSYVDPLPVPEAEVAVARMILGNELAMQFAFPKTSIVEGVDYVVSVTKTYADGREDKNILVPMEQWGTSGSYYYVSFNGIAAKEMGDEIHAQILTADGTTVGDVYTDSVKDYAIRQLRKTTDAKTRTLYVDMLNYGAAAQTYFKYAAENLVTKELTETEKGYGTKSVKLENNLLKGTGYVASQLDLGSSILLRVKFNGIDSSMHAVVSFTNHMGAQKDVTIPGSEFISGGTVVVIDDVVAADYDRDVTITVYDADGKAVANAVESVASYLARQLEKPNPLAIYDAVAKYCAAAYGYLHK